VCGGGLYRRSPNQKKNATQIQKAREKKKKEKKNLVSEFRLEYDVHIADAAC